jgi:hypothetical protein
VCGCVCVSLVCACVCVRVARALGELWCVSGGLLVARGELLVVSCSWRAGARGGDAQTRRLPALGKNIKAPPFFFFF